MNVLITGANGHIGAHVVRAVRAAGDTPIAFVRPKSDRRGLAGLPVEVREGDLLDRASVERAMAGVEIVQHVGAVHRNVAPDPDAIVRPAVEGTRHVLEAARRANVRRVVVTSSGATVGFAKDPTKPLDEASRLASAKSAYVRAKIEEEKVALAAAAEGQDVVVVNPSGVFGPLDYRLTPATRGLIGLLQGDPAFLHLCVTDVRDVARAHVLAAGKGVRGERYLVTGEQLTPAAIAALCGELAGVRPSTFRPPGFLIRFIVGRGERAALRDGTDAPASRDAFDDLAGGHLAYDSSRSREELGMSYASARSVLTDAFRWLLFVDALRPAVASKVRAALGERAAPDRDWSK